MIVVGALLLAAGLFAPQDAEVSAEVAREWKVRSLALGRDAWPEEIKEIGWEERCVILDAIRRADPASLDERAGSFVVESLSDEHSNVRALALSAARRVGVGLPEDTAEELARDLLPEVRLELATTLCSESDPHLRVWGHGEAIEVAELRAAKARFVLLDLALDSDTYVKRRATAGLLSLGAVGLEEQLTWWLSAGMESDPLVFVRALETLSRSPVNSDLARFGRERFADLGDLSRAALWETVVERLGLSMREDTLALGWTVPLGGEQGVETFRVGRLQAAADDRGSQLAQILLSASREEPSEAVRRALAAGIAHAMDLEDTRLLERLALTDPEFARWTWQALFGREDHWNPVQVGPWLHRSVEAELRHAAFSAVTETLTRTGDVGARTLTEALLDDAGDPLFDSAFRALCDAPDPAVSLVALHDAWRKTAEPRRGELLRSLSREVVPVPFREDLLQRWRPQRARDASSLELLATFVDDKGVSRAICTYLAEHIAAFEESALGSEPALEGRLLGLISVSRRLCAGDVLELWDRALAAGAMRSKEVVKAAGAALAVSREGQLKLADWVEMEAPSRARIEAAVLVCELRPVEATRVIIERYQLCDPPLRVRALKALGRAETGTAQRFLEEVAVGVGLDAQVATEAIANSSLSALGRVASMKKVAMMSGDLEVVRTAVEGLATAGSSELAARERAGEALVEILSSYDAALGPLRDDMLLAFARLGVEGDAFASLYLDLPLANASDELEARFRSSTLPHREFLYRGDIRSTAKLAELGSLAGSRWSEILEDSARVLDGQLLLQLAEAARGGGPGDVTARRLLIAAAIALEGEPVNAELELDRARVYASLLSMDLEQSQFKSAAAWASRLGLDWKLGVLSERDLQRLLGDRSADPEPQAFLPASALQAQALLAMTEGRIDAARAFAERGGEVAGRSSRALEHQAILDAALKAVR